MDRRGVLRLIGALAAAGVTGAVSGCGANPNADPILAVPNGKHISIGLIAPAVGPYAKVGDDITKGFKLYLDNRHGLLGLYSIDLHTVDEGATVSDATQAVKQLLDANVLAIAGVASPAALAAIVPEAVNAKVPVLSANAAPTGIGATDFVWRAACLQGEAGEAAANFARTEGRRAYILTDGTPMAAAEATGFTSAYTALGGEIAGTSDGLGSYASRISDAVEADSNVIFAAYTGDPAAALLSAYRSAGISTKLIGPGALTESFDLTTLSPIPANVLTAMFYAADLNNDDNQRFVASYHNSYQTPPSSFAAAAYDTAGLLDRALGLIQGDPDGIKVNDALKVLGDLDTPRGSWTFNANHSPQQTWYLRQLRMDGQMASNMHDSDLAVLS